MASEGGGGDENRELSLVEKWKEVVESRWRKAGEHAEAYPYVWGSYILVYGGLGAFVAYKWRKLRKMEGRVRALQERARMKAEAQEATGSSTSTTTGGGGGASATSSSSSDHTKSKGFPPLP